MKGNTQPTYLRFFLDCCVLTIAFLLTRLYIFYKGDIFLSRFNILLLAGSFFIWYITAKYYHLYDDFRHSSFSYEFIALVKTSLTYSLVITFLFFYFFKNFPYQRTFTLLFTESGFLMLLCQKFIYKQYITHKKTGIKNVKNMIIVGAGELGMKFHKTILSGKDLGYNFIGFVDDVKGPNLNGDYLGKISDLEKIIEKNNIEDVIVALPSGAVNKIEETVNICERNAKRVKILPNYYRLTSGNIKLSNFGNFPIITVRASPLDDAENQFFKRIFDVLFSFVLFALIFSWLFPLIAIIIKCTSRGPVFFKQERWGLNNKKITCYKFRSMIAGCSDLDETGKYHQASKNDPRITRFGRLLRKTNIDEFPQFINVLIGNMSVVGPRPHPIPLNLEAKETIHNYMLRHIVKPGITGWAQVNGFRGETREAGNMQNRVNLDLWYIDNWSFWLDCQIIFQTIMNMIKGDKNAY